MPTVRPGILPSETSFRPRLLHCSVGSQCGSQLSGKRVNEASNNPE